MADIGPEQLADWARAFAAANEAGLRLGRVAIEPKAGGAPVAFALVVVAPDAPDEVRDMLVRGVHREVYRGRQIQIGIGMSVETRSVDTKEEDTMDTAKPAPLTCADALDAAAVLFHQSSGDDAATSAFGKLTVFVLGDYGMRRVLTMAKRWREATFALAKLQADYAAGRASDEQMDEAQTEAVVSRVELRDMIKLLTDGVDP